jgi:LemA protein
VAGKRAFAMGFIIVGAVAAAVVLYIIVTYNRLVGRRNQVQEAWSGIDVQLKRRAELVPNLVSTVQGYQIHERQVLTEVTEARSRMIAAQRPDESGRADDRLEGALTRLFAVAESYPDLKANENFLSLQRELVTLEEDISFARRYYNALTERLNTAIQRFPVVLFAGLLGFERREYFKADAQAREVPTAGFSS